MSDEDKYNIMNEDDEYKLPKDEYVSSDNSHAADASQDSTPAYTDESKPSITERFPILKNKKFLIGVGAVVVVLVAYQFMRPSDDVKVISQKPVTAPVVQTQAPQLTNQLDSLQQTQQDSEQMVSGLKSQVENLQAQLTTSKNDNAALTQAVTQLNAQVKLLSHAVADNAKQLEAAKKPKVTKKKYTPPPLHFTIKAVVPGRAWVVDQNGASYSITVGNKLPQYGRIVSIDANAGIIQTTSGKVVRLGSNDS